MSDKIYPATTHKLQELKVQGRIPFSRISLSAFNVIGVLICAYIMAPHKSFLDLSPLKIDYNATSTLVSDYTPILSYAAKVIAMSFLLSILFRLYLTKLLILPIGRYPKGNLKEKKNKWVVRQNYTLSLCIFAVSVLYILIQAPGIEIDRLNMEYLFSYLITPYIYAISLVLTLAGVISSYFTHQAFHEEQKMSKAEILLELKELEGNPVTKQMNTLG